MTRAHVPVLTNDEPRADLGCQGWLELVQFRAGSDLVRQFVAVRAHRCKLGKLGACVIVLARRNEHAEAMLLELHSVGGHLVNQIKHTPAQGRDGLDAVSVVTCSAVSPEAQQPWRQLDPVARFEVERRVGIEQ